MDNKKLITGMFIVLIIYSFLVAVFSKNSIFRSEVEQGKFSIEDVWYHEPGNYSVGFYDDDGKYTTVSANRCQYDVETIVIKDLPPNATMYYEYRLTTSSFHGCKGEPTDFKIIHMTKDYQLKGGGWNHGKFGHGQTIRVR